MMIEDEIEKTLDTIAKKANVKDASVKKEIENMLRKMYDRGYEDGYKDGMEEERDNSIEARSGFVR